MIQTSRRGFLGLLGATLSAPLIVRAASIMPVKAPPLVTENAVLETMYKNYERVPMARTATGWSAIREALEPGLTEIFKDAFKDIDYVALHTQEKRA